MIKEPYCSTCKHFMYDEEKGSYCLAFTKPKIWHEYCLVPTCIPPEIFSGNNKHTEPYPGDNGIRYEPKD